MDNKIRKSSIHYNRALAFIKDNNITSALDELNISLRFNPKDIDTLNITGLCYYLLCQFDRAEQIWYKSLQLQETENRAVEYLKLFKKKNFQILRENYNKIFDIEDNNRQEQIQLLKNIINNCQELIGPYIILGLFYMEEDKYQQALSYFNKAYQIDIGDKNIQKYILACEKEIAAKGSKRSKYIMIASMVGLLLLISFSTLQWYFFRERSNDHQQLTANYKQEFKAGEDKIVKLSRQINRLQEEAAQKSEIILELEDSAVKQEVLINDLDKNSNLIVNETDELLFVNAFELYKNKRYKQALTLFKNIYNYTNQDYLKRESCFFLARSYQKLGQYDQAVKNYYNYIDNFSNTNYYDDSLYYLGLLLNKVGDSEEGNRILSIIVNEVEDSIFNNSRVRNLINKE